MIPQQKLHLITNRQQKILLLMHESGKRLVFKDQKIYKANGSFKNAMKKLINANFVKFNKPNGNHTSNRYLLTLDGIFLVEDVIKHFIRCNKEN